MHPQHCPNCQHENQPGDQFCAHCGVLLNLKPCPVCGKVDTITATVCTGCGEKFPPLATISPAEDLSPANGATNHRPQPDSPRPYGIRALPLIIVAVVAGGIPLLWMNRNNMPLPKAWQRQAEVAPVVPAAPRVPDPPAAANTAGSPPSRPAAQAATASRAGDEPPVAKPDAAPTSAAGDEPPVAKPEAAPTPSPTSPVEAATKPKPPAPPHPAARQQPASKSQEAGKSAGSPTRECTEALAAVGLCDPKAPRK